MLQRLTPKVRDSGAVDIYRYLQDISGGNVLDVATQRGGFIDTLKKSLKGYSSIIGIDISEEDIEKAKEKHSDDKTSFQVMNAENLSFNDSTFDLVSMTHSLHHLVNPKRVLEEIHRVLKDGGYFILQEHFRGGRQTEAQKADILDADFDAKIDRLLGESHFATLSKDEIHNLVEPLKFEKVELFTTTRPLECLFCDEMEDCEDPMNPEIIDNLIKGVDKNLERAKGLDKYEELKKEGELVKERFRTYGTSTASSLYFICRK